MIHTPAKAIVRRFFYEEFLPSVLPGHLLRASNHLVLLGESTEEVELLEGLGVPLHRVYSIERDQAIFSAQSRKHDQGHLNVVLYYGELVEFIKHYLHTNQRFLVLNLDVYGAYRTSIDPVMTDVLLFARRNPQTVVATYSNVGRDRPQLSEGLKSLVIFHRLAPEATLQAVNGLYGRYMAAGKSPGFSFNMVLRHLFWLRSHIEHALLSRVVVGKANPESVKKMFREQEAQWQKLVLQGKTLSTYQQWLAAASGLKSSTSRFTTLDFGIKDVVLVTYEAHGGFSHTGWFATYQRTGDTPLATWIEETLTVLTSNPLYFAGRGDESLDTLSDESTVPHDLVIWNHCVPFQRPRLLQIPAVSRGIAAFESPLAVANPVPAVADAGVDLSDRIRDLARQGLNTSEVRQRISGLPGATDVSDDSLRSFVANASRQN